MPLDYSKWDALELSDDSDIEVHPNVDKRSFIRAKQNQIHMERAQRKQQIETLKYERIVNDGLLKRISALLASLRAHAADAASGAKNPAEVAFQAVMESAQGTRAEDDRPPKRPEGVHGSEEELPTYTKMMATLLDQVNKAMEEKKVTQEERYGAMTAEIEEHLKKVQDLQRDLEKKLAELEKEEKSKITSESIHTGFDTSHVNKAKAADTSKASSSSQPELLNPNFNKLNAGKENTAPGGGSLEEDDDEMEASPAAREFAKIKQGDYLASQQFLTSHPQLLASEKETDGLLVLAFDAQLQNHDEEARRYVHQALLLQYCRALGRDGVQLFFKRVTTKGHQAQDIFFKDVQETYGKIKNRAAEINAQRARDAAEGKPDGVEQIQLQAVEPGTVINIRVPEKDSSDPEEQAARAIFDGFSPEMKAALETGSLEKVNKVLGEMDVAEAEELVGKFSEAGVLSVEEQIIDTTTEEGKAQLKEIERKGAESQFADDPE
ncbi:hypothetical protein PpBr36_03363 [Pyricularia pennisetigena]|uniref:hypothetical protein n=1 Tax=Pyricularia pennisetigena TaxID=1578925 RepID=UPI001153DD8F|nr:hypothetical protein PpBr36_03363 [Pyricularia pennisetigena]TLS30745.1 hypothetical protein PpBr36_03363 [Pyricularia pennisetigena]